MISLYTKVAEIKGLLARNNHDAAEAKAKLLIDSLSIEDIQINIAEIDAVVHCFFKKRQRNLREILNNKLGIGIDQATHDAKKTYNLDDFKAKLNRELTNLSASHIFQWSTFYRDFFSQFFKDTISICSAYSNGDDILKVAVEEITLHTTEIFTKGYEYTRNANASYADSHLYAITKQIGGLQRFLELPVELYSTTIASTVRSEIALPLRKVSSMVLTGILLGFGNVNFSDELGWQVLTRYGRTWYHYVPFFRYYDLKELFYKLKSDFLSESILNTVLPIIEAIDKVLDKKALNIVLPSLSQFIWEDKRLNVSLEPLFRGNFYKSVDIQFVLDDTYVDQRSLEESVNRGVKLIAAPLGPQIKDFCESHDVLRYMVINTKTESYDKIVHKAESVLEFSINKEFCTVPGTGPITYNFAKDFPLHNPFLTKYFHVYRTSVRDLLRSFEQRNGVRLWCSVRRSGKTTACFDLSTTTGTSVVVSQTCENTDQRLNASLFYDRVIDALACGKQIPNDFFADVVLDCGSHKKSDMLRYVFVLDEYETLFERLRLAVKREKELRYTVVQPLLNQMVTFSRNNLLVFIGQRPDAHYILMDQNQLSAYVQQDSFPLFVHGGDSLGSEFSELVRKIFTDRVTFDMAFLDKLYGETSGHPFLTVKVIILLFDWLIETKRPINKLQLTGEDFIIFSKAKLSPKSLALSNEFDFFKQAISEALSTDGKLETPWLYAMYSIIRQISLDHPTTYRCTLDDYNDIVSKLEITERLGYSPENLLTTGSESNFLTFSNKNVMPKIKILARIAQISTPKISW